MVHAWVVVCSNRQQQQQHPTMCLKSTTCIAIDVMPFNAVLCSVLLPSHQAYRGYKAEVTAFFKSLPPAAVAKLLRVPEPAWLPKRKVRARLRSGVTHT